MSAQIWLGEAWGLLGMLVALAFVALVVLAIAALVRSGGGHAERGGGSPALRLLEERYARGEIPRQEFLERREVLLDRTPGDEP